jgi:prepilin-type N-terminal cleavage/methylation domain-containing protein
MKQQKNSQSGFTLVEISIVLVIIGLLLGGVLKGQEMITQAKIKNVINDFNGVSAAYYSYQDRYRKIPGDDPTASPRWTGTKNGSGDGQIAGNYNNVTTAAPTAGEESNLFWQHLRLAGFVGGTSTGVGSGTQPTNGAGGMIGVQTNAAANNLGFTSTILCSANLSDKIAIAVDAQIDDQSAITGQVRGQLQAGANPFAGPAPTVAYKENGQNQYLLCKSL